MTFDRKICTLYGCENLATRVAHFVLIELPGTEPSHGHTSIFVCAEHATATLAHTLLNDNESGKAQIEKAFNSGGRMAPDWDLSYLEWRDIYKPHPGLH
jgi:hypothetical protein